MVAKEAKICSLVGEALALLPPVVRFAAFLQYSHVLEKFFPLTRRPILRFYRETR